MSGSETSQSSVEKTGKRRRRSEDVRLTIEILQSEKYFSVKKILGRGTYGDVFMMYDAARNSNVAVKIITSENIAEIELQMWPKLRHPNIVPVLEVMTIRPVKVACFVMPVQRKSLHDLLYEKRFLYRVDSLDYLKFWLSQTLCALDYLDSRNLCHLDIKVDNVLISNEYRAMLCDFSFLNYQSEGLKRYDLGLPYIYRPPEACHTLGSDISIEGRSYDMWGFGIMVLEIFTHFVLATNIDDCSNWIKEIYPTLFGILQEKEFTTLMVSTFPGCNISQTQTKLALDFIHSFLLLNPLERSVAVEALEHQFLNRGKYLASCTDPIWTHEVYSKSAGLSSVKSWMTFADGKIYEVEDHEEYDDSSDGYSTMSDSDDGTNDSISIDEYINNLSGKIHPCSGSTLEEQSNCNESLIEEKFFNKNSDSSYEFDFSQMGDISAIKKDERNLCLLNSKQRHRNLSNDRENDNSKNLNKEYFISGSDSKIAQKRMKKRFVRNKRSSLHRYPTKAKTIHLSSVIYKSPCSYKPLENVPNSKTVLEKLHYKKLSKVGSNGRCTFYRVHRKNSILPSNENKSISDTLSDHVSSESPIKPDSKETGEVRADSKLWECSEKLNASEPPKDHIFENINAEPHLIEENSKWATGDTFSTETGDLIDFGDINNPSTSCARVIPSSKVESTILDDDDSIQSVEIMKSVNKTLGQLNEINETLQKVLICENCNAKRKNIEQGNLEHGPQAVIRPDSMPTNLRDNLKEKNEDHFVDTSIITANLKACSHEIIDNHNDFPLDIMNTQNVNLIINSPAMQKELRQLESGKDKKQEGSSERCEILNSLKRGSGWKKWMRNRCLQIERVVKCCDYKILK